MEKFNLDEGKWRTIGGRRVFIREGQSLSDAMKASGKFKSAKKKGQRKFEDVDKEFHEHAQKMEKNYEEFGGNSIEDERKLNELSRERDKTAFHRAEDDYMKKVFGENSKEYKEYKEQHEKALGKDYLKNTKGSKEFTREELKEKYGTDNTDLINAGKEKEDRVALKEDKKELNLSQRQKDAGNELNEKARNMANGNKDNWNIDEEFYAENLKEAKTGYDKLAIEHKKLSDELGKYNAERENIYEGWDEEYENLYGKLPEKNAKNTLSQKDYKKYEELTKKYHETRQKLIDLDNKIEEYKKSNPDEYKESMQNYEKMRKEYDKDHVSGWDLLDKQREMSKEAGREISFIEAEKTLLAEKRAKENDEKLTNNYMNNKIRNGASKNKFKEDLPKKTEIKTQGTSNRKEVSENIQAHILDYYDSPDDFIQQMDAMDYLPTKWRAGEELAKGGSYLIYNGDMADFLNELKINPKGKSFSDEKAFNTYTSLVGRESAKLYDRLKKNAYRKYMKEHPNSEMSFEDFKDMRNIK